ncbi:MAG: IS4 family transposase, partial [Flavobacterium sp.]
METFLHSARFKSFSQFDILNSRYNSIRDRICTINANYFEKLFETVFTIYNKELKEENALSKTDSTYVALATKLFSQGMQNGSSKCKDKRFVKYSVNLKGSLPSTVKVFTDQSYVSEDLALSELINGADCMEGNVVVFDRGIQSRSSFESFTDSGKWFITRSKLDIRCKVCETNNIAKKPAESTVTIISDHIGKLTSGKEKDTKHLYRVIKANIDSSNETICFVTNMLKEDVYQIAAWYKQRWEIELFFKFIKQHLNVNHLVSRDENGIKVMLYMTMILAILIIAYK